MAYVSRSGGMSNELNNIIALNADGVNEGIAIGGDRYIHSEHRLLDFDPDGLFIFNARILFIIHLRKFHGYIVVFFNIDADPP